MLQIVPLARLKVLVNLEAHITILDPDLHSVISNHVDIHHLLIETFVVVVPHHLPITPFLVVVPLLLAADLTTMETGTNPTSTPDTPLLLGEDFPDTTNLGSATPKRQNKVPKMRRWHGEKLTVTLLLSTRLSEI